MKKSQSGIYLRYIAALSFFLVLFDQILLSALLVGLALYVEKDEWLSRQTMQAFFLSFFSKIVLKMTFGLTINSIAFSLSDLTHYSAGAILRILLSGALSLAILIFTILGIVRTLKEQDAGIPFFSGLTYRIFGKIKPTYIPQQPMPYYYQQPGQPPMTGYNAPQQPYQQAQPIQQQPPVEQPVSEPVNEPQQAQEPGTDDSI